VLEDLVDFAFVDPLATALTEDRLVAVTAHAEAEIACGRAAAVLPELETPAADTRCWRWPRASVVSTTTTSCSRAPR
jgi:hypothetical protein